MKTALLFIGAAMGLCAQAPTPIRWANEAEQQQVQDVIRRLTMAVNVRDAAAIKTLTTPRLNVQGAGRWFNEDGVFRFSERQDEDLTGVELATLIRAVRVVAPDVALAEGFFRTLRWPARQYSGDVSALVHRIDGKWLVSLVRFQPHVEDSTFFEVQTVRSNRTGWIALDTLESFTAASGAPAPGGWSVADGALHLAPQSRGGGIRTRETFASFEFEFEWKVPPKGNSGVKYRLLYLTRTDAAGSEYQVADDAGDRGASQHPMERAGALYYQIAPAKAAAAPVGEFNRSRIVVKGRQVEHWLNGEKVVAYETESGPLESPILLQNHGTEIWYRNLRVRRLD